MQLCSQLLCAIVLPFCVLHENCGANVLLFLIIIVLLLLFVDEDPEQRMQDPAAVDADADKVQKARILERHARSTTERARRPSPGTRDRRENQTHWGARDQRPLRRWIKSRFSPETGSPRRRSSSRRASLVHLGGATFCKSWPKAIIPLSVVLLRMLSFSQRKDMDLLRTCSFTT